MIRAVRLAPSRPMYAFKPSTWRERGWAGRFEVDAVWFRRKKGRTVASMGTYHPMVMGYGDGRGPADGLYESWIEAADDNRYGADHRATWDGEKLLCTDQPVTPELAARRVEFLTAMLEGFPEPPPGWDGWWTFLREGSR